MKTIGYTIIIFFLVVIGAFAFFLVRPSLYSPENKVKILMGGRSTMGLWFKHWNWPYPLRVMGTYRAWPIPFSKYSTEGLFLEYLPVKGPMSRDRSLPFGEQMLQSFEAGLNSGRHDAAFFKFCFVDFPVKEEEWQERLGGLTKTIAAAHEMTAKRKMKLIVGNALPLLNPSDATLRLQIEYNHWLKEFAARHDDVRVFDFFSVMVDANGRLRQEFARDKDDDHPNDRAFSLLDKKFFKEVSDWLAR